MSRLAINTGKWRASMAHLAVAVLASVLLHLSVEAQSAPRGHVLKVDQLTKQQFKSLPDEQVVEVKGKRATMREVRATTELSRKRALAQMATRAKQEQAKFEARRAQFLQKQRAALEAENAKARTQLAQLGRRSGVARSTRQAIEEEARQLYAKSKTAKRDEIVEIEKRAQVLLRQLQLLSPPIRPRVNSGRRR